MLTKFIPQNERQNNTMLINQISKSIFGTAEDSRFAEEFVPLTGRVPEPKTINFSNFLMIEPKCLWAVYSDTDNSKVIGFVLISDRPHNNSIGFSVNKSYANKGIMKKAWEEIKTSEHINYPLNAYTSKRNINAIRFLQSIGFVNNSSVMFGSEDSSHFIN